MSSASYEITSQRCVSTWLQSHKRSLLLNEAMLLIFIMISFSFLLLSVFILFIEERERGGTRFFQWCSWKHVPPGHQPPGKYWMKGVLDVSSAPPFLCVGAVSSGPWNISSNSLLYALESSSTSISVFLCRCIRNEHFHCASLQQVFPSRPQ